MSTTFCSFPPLLTVAELFAGSWSGWQEWLSQTAAEVSSVRLQVSSAVLPALFTCAELTVKHRMCRLQRAGVVGCT